MKVFLTNTNAAAAISTPLGPLAPGASNVREVTAQAFATAKMALDANANLAYSFTNERYVEEFGVLAGVSATSPNLTANNTALQAALTWAYNEIAANRPAQLVFPPGDIPFSTTLLMKGNGGGAPSLIAAHRGGPGYSIPKARLVWYGADNGTMLFAESCNRGFLQDIELLANDKAGACLVLSATTLADRSVLAATSGFKAVRCRFAHVKPGVDGNGCVQLGTDPSLTGGSGLQQSETLFEDCDFVGESESAFGFTWSGLKAFGIKNMSGGNCKNHTLIRPTFSTCDIAADFTHDSGHLRIDSPEFGNCRTGISQTDSDLVVTGGDMECSSTLPTAKILVGGGTGVGSAELRKVQCAVDDGANALLLAYAGRLLVDGGFYYNNANSFWFGSSATTEGQTGVLRLRDVLFRKCGATTARPYAPIIDGLGGNDLAPVDGGYGGYYPLHVSSTGCYDDQTPSGVLRLNDFQSAPTKTRIIYEYQTGITAHAGGGQGSAWPLGPEINFISTVASAGDSAVLPSAGPGMRIVVFNLGANAADVFPATGGAIDALGTNTAYSLAAGASREFWASSITQWYSR